MNGKNQKEVIKILDPIKEANKRQLITVSMFTGATFSQVFMLVMSLGLILDNTKVIENRYFYLQFFQLESLFRLIFSIVFASTMAGYLIKVW